MGFPAPAAWRADRPSRVAAAVGAAALSLTFGCREPEQIPTLTVASSTSGPEAEVLARQLEAFQRLHPGIRVKPQPVPDAADQRHQLYVPWLNLTSSSY